MIIGRLKGGIGSGFHGHQGRPGQEGGSLPRGVLSSQISQWRKLNIPDKGEYFEKVDKIIADPRDDSDSGIGTWSSYMVTPNGDIYWCELGHNKAAKEIIENNTLTSAEDIERKKYRVDLVKVEAYSNDNYLIHNFGFTRVMISKDELTLQTHILDKSTLRFLQGLYDEDKMELRNKIVWVGALDIESGLSPKSYAVVNASREEFLDAKYIVQDPNDKPEYKDHAYLLKESRLKGGVGSGFFDHQGRKGLVGGSVARGVLSSGNKYSDKLIIPTSDQSRMDDYYFGIKEIRVTDCARGSGSFFITDNGTVLELVAGDHASATAAIARANGMEYGDGDNEITPRRLVTEYGFIRLNMTPHGANFEVAELSNSVLRKLQKLVDDGEVDIASKFEVIMSNAETFEYVQAPMQDFLSAKYVVLQNANSGEYVLKESIFKGGPGSGHHGHIGIPGHKGGSLPRGVLSSQVSEDLIRQANRTSRNAGAVGAKAITPRYVEIIAKPSDTILDFGAGKAAAHALRLRSLGLNVTPYEFGDNSIPGLHNPNALKNKYSIVYASNVLNVQGSNEMLQDTLNQLTGALKNSGKLVVNLPGTPRYGAWDGLTDRQGADKLQSILMDRFEKVVRVGGTTSTPLFEASELKINKEMFIGRLKGGIGSGHFGHRGRLGHQGGSLPKNSSMSADADVGKLSYIVNQSYTESRNIQDEYSKYLQSKGVSEETADQTTQYITLGNSDELDYLYRNTNWYTEEVRLKSHEYVQKYNDSELAAKRNIYLWQAKWTIKGKEGYSTDMVPVSPEYFHKVGMKYVTDTNSVPNIEDAAHILYDKYGIMTHRMVPEGMSQETCDRLLSDIVKLANYDTRIDTILKSGALRAIIYDKSDGAAASVTGRDIRIHNERYGSSPSAFIHELGHILDDSRFYREDKSGDKSRDILHNEIFNKGMRPSMYAFTNTMEDYAESFVNLIVGTNYEQL